MTDIAIGFIETRGFLGMACATDAMNKSADVDFIRQEQIGSGFVTAIVGGEVGAVRTAVSAGGEAVKPMGTLLHAATITRIHPQARALCIDWKEPEEPVSSSMALGLIETQGYAPMVTASDAAVKAAEVVLTNYYIIGSGYATVAMRGDVGAVRAAVNAGAAAAGGVGKLVAAHVIPRPHQQIQTVFRVGGAAEKTPDIAGAAIGYLESHGLVTLIAAADAAVKSAHVALAKYVKIGSGVVSFTVRGEVAAVGAAVNAGRTVGGETGKVLTANVIPSPHAAVEKSSAG